MDNPACAPILRGMDTDIIIVGGSLNGTALALALAQGGVNVTMIDALPKASRKKKSFDGRSYAMALATTRMLRAVGLWEALAPDAEAMNAIKVSDCRAGQIGLLLHQGGHSAPEGWAEKVLDWFEES